MPIGKGIVVKIGILHVTSSKKPPRRLRICIRSPWLADMGFVHGVPILAIPQQNGFAVVLQGEHDGKTKAEGGTLMHVGLSVKKMSNIMLNFSKNFSIAETGLSVGDFLAAKYEYGIITARKLPDAQKYYIVVTQNREPFLRMSGEWLLDAGFPPDTIVTVAVSAARENITFYAWKGTTEKYDEMVKFARKQKYHIIQTRKNQQLTVLDAPGYILEHATFKTGDMLGVRYQNGVITLFKPDLRKLGF